MFHKQQSPLATTGRSPAQRRAKRNLILVLLESTFAYGVLSMPIMTLFFTEEIGLSFGEIAMTQSIFTIVTIFMNAPLGLLADCISRKWVNIIGDFGLGIIHLFYAMTQNIGGVIACEILLGVFGAMSKGVDISLIHHFNKQMGGAEESASIRRGRFIRINSNLQICQNIFNMILMVLGGIIGAIDYRLAIALSAIGYLIGATIELFVQDDSKRMQSGIGADLRRNLAKLRRSFKEPGLVSKLKFIFACFALVLRTAYAPFLKTIQFTGGALKDKLLSSRMFAVAICRQIGHGLIWIYSPMLIMVGLPKELLGFGWVFTSLANILGAALAKRYALKMSMRRIVAIGSLMSLFAIFVMFIDLNIFTMPLYFLISAGLGWFSAAMPPHVQEASSEESQATVASLTSTGGSIIYAITGWIIGCFADSALQVALLVNFVIFAPLCLFAYLYLRRYDKVE